ncbi:MAG: hypothetical protein V4558_08560 [Gemmatimonadota bacterium]
MAQLAALLLALFGLLPIANWIAGGHAAPWYDERLRLWSIGGALVAAAAISVGAAIRRWPTLWADGAWGRVSTRWHSAGRRADAGIALSAGVIYAGIARIVFSAKPLLTDEIIQLYQARIFASGHLWLPAPAHPEFTSAMNLIDWGGKVYGQFPAGGPAMLALGTLLHIEWLVGPIAAAAGVYCFARLLRIVEPRIGVALAALLLFALAPFTMFLGGSMMNHTTTLAWLLGAALALAHATRATAPAGAGAVPRAALLLGVALGVAATIRPLDGLAFALPAAVWLLLRALRGGRAEWIALIASGIGVALPLAALFWVNNAQTGHPLEFGYITMWGRSHELGFHDAPWGPPHTPARGLELINLYLLRLQTWFLETPVPALLFATGALALTRVLTAFDRYVLASCGLLLLAYFAYWHDGFYLGPRFVLPLAPWLALWTARFPSALAERGASLIAQRMTLTAGITALLLGGLVLLPIRAEQYRAGLPVMRLDADDAARTAGVHDAIVLVRESWGAQLYARMWGLGVSRIDAHNIYSRMDICRLDALLQEFEGRGGTAADFLARARPIADASHRLVRLRNVGDSAVHLMAGATVSPACLRRIRENQAGFTTFAPLLLAGKAGNHFVRDLHALDSLLLREHPGKPVYLLVRDTTATAPLRLLPVAIDSAVAEWRARD